MIYAKARLVAKVSIFVQNLISLFIKKTYLSPHEVTRLSHLQI